MNITNTTEADVTQEYVPYARHGDSLWLYLAYVCLLVSINNLLTLL